MPENIKCPECKGPMASRKNGKDGSRFWGCRAFPKCRGTRDSDGLSAEERRVEREMMAGPFLDPVIHDDQD